MMNSFEHFDPLSRIWVYESTRLLTPSEVLIISDKVIQFTDQWTAHQQLLKAGFEIRNNLFLVFCVDEKNAAASGCSIDKSLHIVQQLEKDYNISLLNRMMSAYKVGEEVIPFNLKDLNQFFSDGVITSHTLVFDNLVNTLADLNNKWMIPLNQSWMMQMMKPVEKVNNT